MRVSTAVQHHPARADLLPALLHLLDDDAEVVADPDPDGLPSAIRTYLECMRRTPPSASHRIVIQDDAMPVPGFPALAREAAAERPDDLLAFFVPHVGLHGKFMVEAHKRGQRWVNLPRSARWAPAVCVCWPGEMVPDFIAFTEDKIDRRRARGMDTFWDDPVIGEYARAREFPVVALVPSIVEHPDVVYSIVKRRTYDGSMRNRKAAVLLTPSDR